MAEKLKLTLSILEAFGIILGIIVTAFAGKNYIDNNFVNKTTIDTLKVEIRQLKEKTLGFDDWKFEGKNDVYQASSDGFVVAKISTNNNFDDQGYLWGYTNADSNKVVGDQTQYVKAWTKVQYVKSPNGKKDVKMYYGSFIMPVRKGDYWRVKYEQVKGTDEEPVEIFWLPITLH